MFIGPTLRNLRIQGKVLFLTSCLGALLLIVGGLGYWGIEKLQHGEAQLNDVLPKLSTTTKVLHEGNVLRIVHVSMIGAAHNPDYLAKRSKRLTEVEGNLREAIAILESLPWSELARPLALEGAASMRRYAEGFPQVLEQAKANQDLQQLPSLIEANFQDQAKGRDQLLKLIALLQKQGADTVAQDGRTADRQQWVILAGVGAALLLGAILTRVVGRQVASGAQTIEAVMSSLSSGDLRHRAEVEGRDELGAIAESLNQVIAHQRKDLETILSLTERIASSSSELAASATELDATTSEISRGAVDQRSEVERSSAALEEMGASIRQVKENAQEVDGLAQVSQRASLEGLQNVSESTQAMGAIQDSADRVGLATRVIVDIARQSNLLSLNAAIEAAKAGVHGKGFAVVAEEVRKLAERSAGAAKEITGLMEESRATVASGSRAVEAVERSLALIESNIRTHATRVREIALAMEEQDRASQDVVRAMGTTTLLTERNAAATVQLSTAIGETSRAVDGLAHMAQQLSALTTHYRLA